MKYYSLHHEQFIPRPLREVFRFFENPENLGLLTPPELRFRIQTPGPIVVRSGLVIDYTIHLLGIPMRWQTLITEYDPPNRFADVQAKGPYKVWIHTHSFEAVKGGTKMTDDVRYALPFGVLGRLAHALFVKRQLDKIFRYRAHVLELQFDGRN